MKTLVRFATTAGDRRLARELRDEIRTLNLARFGRDPDGEVDPRMDGRTLCAHHGAKVVGSIDVHWGGDSPIPSSKMEHHQVQMTAPEAPMPSLVVLDGPIVHPEWSHVPLEVELNEAAARFAFRNQVRWVFSACHPTDSSVYNALGFRACGAPTRNRMHGDHLPIVLDFADVALLKRVRSPFAALAEQARAAGTFDSAAEQAKEAAAPPRPVEAAEEKLDGRAVWRQIFELQRQARASGAAFLSDIQDSEIGRLLLGSQVIAAPPGERIIKQGEKKRDLFLILTGQVEVRHDGRLVAMLGAGDVVGEIGLLLNTERTSDVVSAGEDTRYLRITEAHLQEVMAKDPALAARISLGIAKALCLKLIRASGLA